MNVALREALVQNTAPFYCAPKDLGELVSANPAVKSSWKAFEDVIFAGRGEQGPALTSGVIEEIDTAGSMMEPS